MWIQYEKAEAGKSLSLLNHKYLKISLIICIIIKLMILVNIVMS